MQLIPFRQVLATAPLVMLIWVGLAAYLFQKHQMDITSSERDARNLSYAFEENIRRNIESIDTTLRSVRMIRAQDPARFNLVNWIRQGGLDRDLTLQLSIADRTGAVQSSNLSSTTSSISIADREHFIVTRDQPEDRLFISRPVVGRVSGKASIQFVRKLFAQDGSFDGVIVASVDPLFLSRFAASLDIGRGVLILVGQDLVVRSASPVRIAALGTTLSDDKLKTGLHAAQSGIVETAMLDGVSRITGWRRVEPYGLAVIVGLARADALVDYQRDLRQCTALGLMLTLVTFFVGVIVTRNRRELIHSRAILRAAVDNISQGLFLVDAQRRVPLINNRAVELLHLPPELRRPGLSFDDLLRWQVAAGEFDGPDGERVLALVRSGGIETGNSVYQRTRRNGVVLEFRTRTLETGVAVRTITDVTEQQRTAQVLAQARDAAEAAARAHSEFLAVMSHEVRTPLNGIIGVAELLADMHLDHEQGQYVQLIRSSGEHLLRLINDILDFSRLDAGRIQLEVAEFDPATLIRNVADLFNAQAMKKGLALRLKMQPGLPSGVIGDPGRLRQVLLNLVGNAVKFTETGWVSIAASFEEAPDRPASPADSQPRDWPAPDEPQPNGHHQIGQPSCNAPSAPSPTFASANRASGRRLVFSVTDTGIGIPPEAVERMFEKFTQMDGSISRRYGGSGLGLAICRRLVELMGGRLTVTSEPGIGSTFQFDVPLTVAISQQTGPLEPTPVQAPSTTREIPAGLRVLLAEDNETNRVVALRLLDRLGLRTDTVSTGQEALTALDQTAYDLVLMDVMMPELDGLAATRRIRAGDVANADVTIVGLTARSRHETLHECLAAGMDAVTTKPVTIARLRAAISDGLDRRGACRLGTAPPGPPLMQQAVGSEAFAKTGATSRLHALAEVLGDDAVAELVETFAQDSRLQVRAMSDAAARGDIGSLHRAAHSVAGAARNVGADALAGRAAALEQGLASLSSAQIIEAIGLMQTDLDLVLQALSATARTPVTGQEEATPQPPSG